MAEENSGFQALIDSVNKSNTSLANVEEHTRNSRRHLLEMKKSVFQMAEITEQLASPDTESRREDVARQERMIDALEAVKGNTGKSAGGGGGPLNSTKPLVLMIYEFAFEEFKLGRASALTVILFLILLFISLLQLWLMRKKT